MVAEHNNMEEELNNIKAWMQNSENWMKGTEAKQKDLLEKLAKYEQEQTAWKEDLAGAVRMEIGRVTGSLGELYSNVQTHITMFEERIRKVEQEERKMKTHKSLLYAKDMKPNVLNKDEEWRRWKSDVEDYTEEAFAGMKDMLEKVKDAEAEVNEEWFTGTKEEWWSKGEMLWRFLKKYTGTEARRVVQGVSEDNGWEAWRKLHQQFEPGTVTREAMVLARYTNMVNRKAKTPKETKALLIELNERAKRVEEVTGKPVEDRHAMSVISGILDPETSKHTAQFQGLKSNIETLKRKVMEFTNLVTSHTENRMDLDRVQEQVYECDEEYGDDEDEERLNAFNEKCHACGGYGHYARECANKGKGKGYKGDGKGKGSKGDGKGRGFKGDGKGKGQKGDGKGAKGKGKSPAPQFGSCWNCGGAHFARDCPQAVQSKGNGKGEVRVLSSIRQAPCARVTTQNRYQALATTHEDEGDDQEEEEKNEGTVGRQSVSVGPRTNHGHRQGVACDKLQRGSGEIRRRWNGGRQVLGSLVEVAPEGVNSMEEQEWEELEMAVDSGATETVVGEDMLKNIHLKEGSAYKRGVQYEVASGELIPNLGEKQFLGYSDGGEARNITAQVCDVNKALLSVKKMVQAGNRVVFEPTGGYIEDIASGEKLHLREQGGMYMLRLWVKSPFHGQAQ